MANGTHSNVDRIWEAPSGGPFDLGPPFGLPSVAEEQFERLRRSGSFVAPSTARRRGVFGMALLEDEIVRGVRPLGDQLPSEREMMRLFGVGRPAIREALFALRRKGLVKVGNGTRARVTQPTPAAILGELSGAARHLLEQPGGQQHFQEARSFFEIALARYAARHATTKDLARLEVGSRR